MIAPCTYRVEPITAGDVRKGDKLLVVDKFGARVVELLTAPEKVLHGEHGGYLAEAQWDGVEPMRMVVGYPKQTLLKVHDDG